MREQESIPVPRGWTGGAAWKGAGASLLLHLFVRAAGVVALSRPPKAPPHEGHLTLPAPGSPHGPPSAAVPSVRDSVKASAGRPPGTSGAGFPPAADFAWIRDAIQGAITYPATARRRGWEG